MFGQIFTSYILQIIIQQELQKLTKILLKNFFKDINFPVKIIDTQKIEKKNSITNSVFCYKNKKKYLFYVSKNSCEKKNMLITDIEEGKILFIIYKLSVWETSYSRLF